ncbi:MAG TPA: hypothetical protein VGR57_04175 [Ktedonobacterales bacterium]|nr:hypothetical protein [Ktedonobacterales bacterium]
MQSIRAGKTLISAVLALLLVLSLVLPVFSTEFLAGKDTPWDIVQAGAIHWAIVGGVFIVWLGVQLFWNATPETSKLSLAASATILWLSLALFFNFRGSEQFGGPVAFFTLVGGLGVTVMWTRFLADDITF